MFRFEFKIVFPDGRQKRIFSLNSKGNMMIEWLLRTKYHRDGKPAIFYYPKKHVEWWTMDSFQKEECTKDNI